MNALAFSRPADDVRRGILWVLLSALFAVMTDAASKWLIQSYPLSQVLWVRFSVHFAMGLALVGRALPTTIVTSRLPLQLARSACLFGATAFFISALKLIPLADGMAILFLSPVFATALSVPLLGEKVGIRRWAGVIAGFAGAMIVIRPGTGVMGLGAVLAVIATIMGGLYHLTTRRLGLIDRPLTTVLYTPLVAFVAFGLVAPFVWVPPDATAWALMISMGVFSVFSHYAFIHALQLAPVAVASPLTYTSLIWATLFGYIVFAELPDAWTILGAAIIAGSGLYIFHRERARRAASAEAP